MPNGDLCSNQLLTDNCTSSRGAVLGAKTLFESPPGVVSITYAAISIALMGEYRPAWVAYCCYFGFANPTPGLNSGHQLIRVLF